MKEESKVISEKLDDIMQQNQWLKVFKANYNGLTLEAKELEHFIKKIKYANYIPWAVMERMLYQQDPNTIFEVIYNDENGGVVFTNTDSVTTIINKNENKEYYVTTWCSHFVRVKVTFLGKTIIEDYPVQEVQRDKGYVATKFIDASMVNKAIQRAKAKVASRVSGLALKLYEGTDLQFEDEPVEIEKPKKYAPKVKTEEVKNFKIPEKSEKIEEIDNKYIKFAEFLIKNKDKVYNTIKEFNTQIASTYGFTLTLEEPATELGAKLSKMKNGEVLFKAILTQSGFDAEKIVNELNS